MRRTDESLFRVVRVNGRHPSLAQSKSTVQHVNIFCIYPSRTFLVSPFFTILFAPPLSLFYP